MSCYFSVRASGRDKQYTGVIRPDVSNAIHIKKISWNTSSVTIVIYVIRHA